MKIKAMILVLLLVFGITAFVFAQSAQKPKDPVTIMNDENNRQIALERKQADEEKVQSAIPVQRYQLIPTQGTGNPFLLDTQTGRVWRYQTKDNTTAFMRVGVQQ